MTLAANLIRLLILAVLLSFLPAGVSQAAQKAAAPAAASVTDIKVSFKLDSRLTQGMYMGERWVSPPTYTGVREGKEITVDAKAKGLDAWGKPTGIALKWIPADPNMVTVTPGQRNEVKITVRRDGQSSLKIAAAGFSRELLIMATYQGNAIQVNITQKQ